MRGRSAAVITVSTRASAGVYEDKSGPLVADGLVVLGFHVERAELVPDVADDIASAIKDALGAGVDLLVTTGGTGISPSDVTPDVTRGFLDRELPGIAEAMRAHSRALLPTVDLSRAVAGVSGRTLIVNLPGSTGGVRDGLAVLAPVVHHALDQINGGDHAS